MERGLIGDFFCGAGGASVGIENAFGRSVDFAINHDATAIMLHSRNHPATYHMKEDIFTADIEEYVSGRKVSLIWASPDCTHFSKAKGNTPRSSGIRMLPFAVYYHAAKINPEVICMENVTEIQNWAPIEDREGYPNYGKPVKELEGVCYHCFVAHMTDGKLNLDGRPTNVPESCRHFCDSCQVVREGYTKSLGYCFESKELCAADYGAPTTRKRWYAVIRKDGRPIKWPKRRYSQNGENGLKKWIPASEILDLDNLGSSIFGRKKPLAQNTMRRIAQGIEKYVFNEDKPFIVHAKSAEIAQFLTKYYKTGVGQSVEEPLHTITTSPGHFGLVSIESIPKSNLSKASLKELERAHQVSQFLLAYYGSDIGQSLDLPLRTIVTKERFALVTVFRDNRVLMDIHLRMLSPDELKCGNGFPNDYDISHDTFWHKLPIHEQVAKIGNAVVPIMAESIVSVNCPYLYEGKRIPFVQLEEQKNGQLSFV